MGAGEKEEEKDVWGLYYQISMAIRSLTIIWRMSNMEQDGGSEDRGEKTPNIFWNCNGLLLRVI